MGWTTIQQWGNRIKMWYRLGWYDAGQTLKRFGTDAIAWLETEHAKSVLQVTTLVLSTTAAFLMGRISGLDESNAPGAVLSVKDRVPYATSTGRLSGDVTEHQRGSQKAEGKIVASRKGKRWHYSWCPGAESISTKNKRWFQSEAAAEAAGYTKASNCD
jgi:hypothetical protein